jgi:hypothetical protein
MKTSPVSLQNEIKTNKSEEEGNGELVSQCMALQYTDQLNF